MADPRDLKLKSIPDVEPRAHRAFFRAFLVFLALFVFLNYVVWIKATRLILTEDVDPKTKAVTRFCGDLTRLGYVSGSTMRRANVDDLPRRHIESADWKGERVDVLTVGVSNSNGMGGGRNRFYQDYIASRFGVPVLNIQLYRNAGMPQAKSPLDTLWIALNAGYLDQVRPRTVWLECGQRVLCRWNGHPIDGTESEPAAAVAKFYREAKYENPLDKVKFVNEGNLKYLLNLLLYRYSDNAFFSQTYRRELSRPMFSVEKPTQLLFIHEDLDYLPDVTPDAVRQVNENVNRLADRLAEHGMKLVFMLSADKYDVYRELIVNNPYPKPQLFDLMRDLPKRYTYVDTEAVWLPMVRAGEMDVFFADDTHWSWKASQRLAESVTLP